jgi:hypothetical protein
LSRALVSVSLTTSQRWQPLREYTTTLCMLRL